MCSNYRFDTTILQLEGASISIVPLFSKSQIEIKL